ncbi:hypothetical protein KBD18_01160 [Patescibacteria group bacterium]|nr:hypothetical protein [Patescibacteria group bacterium]
MTKWEKFMWWVSMACRPVATKDAGPYRDDAASARAQVERLEEEVGALRNKQERPSASLLPGGVCFVAGVACAAAVCLTLLPQSSTTTVEVWLPTPTQPTPVVAATTEMWVNEPPLAPLWARALGLVPQSPQNVCEVKPSPTCPPVVGAAVRAAPR